MATERAIPVGSGAPHRPSSAADADSCLVFPDRLIVEERSFWAAGYRVIAGLDEVGRGPLAGPAVAAAVLLTPEDGIAWAGAVNDSKQVPAGRRDRLAREIRERLPFGIGLATVDEIDGIGIAPACRLAMIRALASLPVQPDALLLDAFRLPESDLPQLPIVKGDSRSLTIAAASLVAKVERDILMIELAEAYPGYGFDQHKGYGTPQHLAALDRLGPSPHHRKSFAPIAQLALWKHP